MNYNVRFCSLLNDSFDTVIRLMIESAREADYMVHTYTDRVLSPHSTIMLEMQIIGSSRKDLIDVVLDFDGIYTGDPVEIHITPKLLDLPRTETCSHYWGVAGSLFRVVPDLSPAYVTSYLLDKNMSAELAVYKQYTMTSLPLHLQEIIALKIS